MANTIQIKRGVLANIGTLNPAEFAFTTDSHELFIGDGVVNHELALDRIEKGTAQGQLAFWDSTAAKWVHTETSELFWNDVNKSFGIGTTAPGYKLDVKGDVRATSYFISGSYLLSATNGYSLFGDGELPIKAGYGGSKTSYITLSTNNGATITERMRILADGNVGIDLTTPTSKLHLAAGSATAGTSPLGFTSGPLLTVPVAGKVEFDTDAWYGTITTGEERKQFAFTSDITAAGHNPITLAAIGSTPNANGMTLSTQVLNLEPASASFGGVVTTGTQTFAGAKTYSSQLTSSLATGTSPFAVTSTTVNTNLNADLLDGRHWSDAVGLVTIPTTQVAYGNATSDGLTSDANLTRTSELLTLKDGTLLLIGGAGTTPASDAGIRLMWIPSKYAFRAGSVDGTQWDDANIGNYSLATGNSTTASGTSSSAFGDNSVASAEQATALSNSTANGATSVAMTSGEANAGLSVAIGTTVVDSYLGVAIGRYNIGGGTPTSWVSTDPIFEIGIGSNPATLLDAIKVLKSGEFYAYYGFHLTGGFYDTSGDIGTSGQILSSTATGTTWINNWSGDLANYLLNTTDTFTGTLSLVGSLTVTTGLITAAASTTAGAGFNLREGGAPTSPNDGDIWTTGTGMYIRAIGVTKNLLWSSSGTPIVDNQVAIGNGDGIEGSTNLTWDLTTLDVNGVVLANSYYAPNSGGYYFGDNSTVYYGGMDFTAADGELSATLLFESEDTYNTNVYGSFKFKSIGSDATPSQIIKYPLILVGDIATVINLGINVTSPVSTLDLVGSLGFNNATSFGANVMTTLGAGGGTLPTVAASHGRTYYIAPTANCTLSQGEGSGTYLFSSASESAVSTISLLANKLYLAYNNETYWRIYKLE